MIVLKINPKTKWIGIHVFESIVWDVEKTLRLIVISKIVIQSSNVYELFFPDVLIHNFDLQQTNRIVKNIVYNH